MLLSRLINPKPSVQFIFIIFCIIFSCLPLFYNSLEQYISPNWIVNYLTFFAIVLLIYMHSVGINNLICKKDIIKKDNITIAFSYILLTSPFFISLKEFVFSFILLFFLKEIFESYQKERPFKEIFNASLFVGCLGLFDSDFYFFILLIIISSVNYGNLTLRNLIIAFLGVLIPFLFFYCIKIIIGVDQLSLTKQEEITSLSSCFKHFTKPVFLWFCIFGIINLFAFYELFKWLYKKSIKSRKSFIILIFYAVITVLISFFYHKSLYYLLTPLAVIFGNYFTYTKRRFIANILFLILLFSSLYVRLLFPFNNVNL